MALLVTDVLELVVTDSWSEEERYNLVSEKTRSISRRLLEVIGRVKPSIPLRREMNALAAREEKTGSVELALMRRRAAGE